MKTLLASGVSLLLGLAVGWYIEHQRAEREKTEIVEQMVTGIESELEHHAARAARAIQWIDSGKQQEAVQLLCAPIADYYSRHADPRSKDERSARVLGLIEQLGRTNQAVAARIAEASKGEGKAR